jgi:hypothetical protein
VSRTSSLPAYQAIAHRHGTAIVAASEGFPLKIGGGITKHPFVLGIASDLRDELRAAGAEAKLTNPDDDGRVFVYLSGCSFFDRTVSGSPKFMIKRIGYSEYLASETPTFSHVPAGAIYFDSETDAQAMFDRVWPTVNARASAQCFIVRVA